jgi:hypothetical protein
MSTNTSTYLLNKLVLSYLVNIDKAYIQDCLESLHLTKQEIVLFWRQFPELTKLS